MEVSVASQAEHSGRNARNTILTWKAVDCQDVQRTVIQAGKPEYVDIADSASAPKGGKVVTISGISNSKKLTFSLGTGDLELTLPANYTAASLSIPNGTDITGDPGAANEYDFSLSLQFPANATVEEISRVLKVTAEGGQEAQIDIKQAAGDAFITVEPTEITLEADGTAVSVTVKSNTQWSAS